MLFSCRDFPAVTHFDLFLTVCGCRTGEKVQEQRAADAEAAHGAGRAEGKRYCGAGCDPGTGAEVQ